MRKIFIIGFTLQIFVCFNPSFSNSVFTPKEIKQFSNIPVKIHFNGEYYYSDKLRLNFDNEKPRIESYMSSEDKSSAWASEIQLNSLTRNYYDLQSNGAPQLIWRNPNNLDLIHVIYTSSQQSSGWTDRNVDYYYSSDAGLTLSYIGPVAYGYVAGFGAISGLSDGRAIIAANAKLPSTPLKTVIFLDAFPGLGSFSSLIPNGNYLSPKIIGGENISLNNKFSFIASSDTLKYNNGQSLFTNNFSGYTNLGNSVGESYCIARGTGGAVGIAYVIASNSDAMGDVYFVQSTDYGQTFSGAVRIFDSNFNTDSLGGFKGISMLYKNNVPQVAFETVKQTTDGSYFPGAPSKIRFWNPNLSGGSFVIADENNVPYAPARGTTDLEAPICRPSLGISTDGTIIFCAMTVQNAVTGGNDTTSFNDIFITYSYSSGTSFRDPKRANSSSPRYDWSYPVVSNINNTSTFSPFINLVAQKDIIPGSNVNTPNSLTDAKFYYLTADITNNTLPSPPSLTSPLNNSTNVITNPNFIWNNSGDFSEIQISSSIDFNNIIHSARVTSASYQLALGILNLNTQYYWRVRRSINGEMTPWSYVYSFTTRTTSVNNLSGNIPERFRLYSNYPNPFNPSTKIKFDLPKSAFVKINVFDNTGKIISELSNEILSAGTYETEFTGAHLSSGIYYYRIETENFTETRKMILMK